KVDIQTHAITIIPVPETTSRLSNILSLGDGDLYFAESDSGVLVQYNPTSKVFTSFPVTSPSSGLDRISIAINGSISFTDQARNQVGLFDVASQYLEQIPLAPGSDPSGMSGNYFTEPGTNTLAEINPFFHTIDEFPVPTANAGVGAMNSGSSGFLFFGE